MRSDPLIQKISWGSYQSYSGPYFRGSVRFKVPPSPTWEQKLLGVVTATEGGAFDAVNMYDRCILSVGLIQWCEAANIFGTTKLLGKCAERDLATLSDYLIEMPGRPVFRQNGVWRFLVNGVAVDDKTKQRDLYLGGASGLAGQWDAVQKGHARRVCAVMAALWSEPEFQDVQIDYTAARMLSFAMPDSRKLLFAGDYPKDGWEGAVRAGFISFAANLPAVADQQLRKIVATTEYQAADARVRCIMALRALTFGPNIAIYPHRYHTIRPVLERTFGIDLPDFAEELHDFQTEKKPWRHHYYEPRALQQALLMLGFDLGRAGADGVIGRKTKEAIRDFEKMVGLPNPDGIPDDKFLEKLYEFHQRALDRQENERANRVVSLDELDVPDVE